MPLPTTIADLSTTAASNYPAGTDSPSTLDDVQRAHGAFIAQLRDGTGFTAGAIALADTTGIAASGANTDITSLTAHPVGKMVAQVQTFQTGAVATGTTLIPYDDTIPQITEGDQYLSLAITPQNAASTLVIDVLILISSSAASQALQAALFQDSTASALAVGLSSEASATFPKQVGLKHVMTAGTTSATTFKVRAGGHLAGTTTFNGIGSVRYYGGVMSSRITITEYLP